MCRRLESERRGERRGVAEGMRGRERRQKQRGGSGRRRARGKGRTDPAGRRCVALAHVHGDQRLRCPYVARMLRASPCPPVHMRACVRACVRTRKSPHHLVRAALTRGTMAAKARHWQSERERRGNGKSCMQRAPESRAGKVGHGTRCQSFGSARGRSRPATARPSTTSASSDEHCRAIA